MAHEYGELNQGVFTYYLCEGLSGKAANQQGEITIESLVDYVKTSVGNWCDRQTLKQTPHFQSDLSGSLVLSTSIPSPQEEPITADSPFAELVAGIDEHLSRVPEDTRRLTFTSDEEWGEVRAALHSRLEAKLAELSHPAITAQVGRKDRLEGFDFHSWQELSKDVASYGLTKEFTGKTTALEVNFVSTEVVVPKTSLHVALARFNFFYWVWYRHVCHGQQLQGRFTPKPARTKGFFTFKPSAVKDIEKIDCALTELLSRVSDEVLTWARQLGEYVESRVDPLRKVGPIIE